MGSVNVTQLLMREDKKEYFGLVRLEEKRGNS